MTAAQFSIVQAQLLNVVLECILFGVHGTLAIAAVYFLTSKRDRSWSIGLLSVTILMLLVASAHLILKVNAAFHAFGNDVGETAAQYYGDMTNANSLAFSALVAIQIVIGDSFFIYRCYIVWGRNWHIIVLPTFMLVGTAVAAFGAAATMRQAISQDAFMAYVTPWVTAGGILTFLTSALVTGLITGRIYSNRRAVSRAGIVASAKGLQHTAMATIIESAAIYLASITCLLILSLVHSNAEVILLSIEPSIIGITFSAIIVRISLGLSDYNMASASATTSGSSRQVVTIGGTRHLADRDLELSTRIRPTAIHVGVDQLVHSEMDRDSKRLHESHVV